MIMILILISLVLCSIPFAIWYKFFQKPRQIIKGLISQGATLLDFPKDPYDDFYGFKKTIQKYPDTKVIVQALPGMPALYFVETDFIKQVLANHQYYSKVGKTSELSQLFNLKGIILAEEDNWKLHRKIISGAFQYDLFNGMIPHIVDITQEVLSIDSKQKRMITLPDTIELITSEVITRIFFGLKSRDIIINGKIATDEATEIIQKMLAYNRSPIRFTLGMWALNIYSDYRELKKKIINFRETFRKKIQERMQKIKDSPNQIQDLGRKDLLQILLQHQIKHKDDPTQTLTDDEILDEFAVFFIAGKDTTSLLLSLSLYCCVTYPEWANKLKKEIDETFVDFEKINLDMLNSMDTMTAFLNEVLRMYPPGPGILPRMANRDHYVGEYFVRKGDVINTLFICNNYNPKYFEEPEKFDPNRWLKNESTQEGWKNNSFAYLPFSAGPRNCVGKHLALMEAKIILSYILRNFDLEIDPDFRLSMGLHVVGYGPKKPIPLTLVPK